MMTPSKFLSCAILVVAMGAMPAFGEEATAPATQPATGGASASVAVTDTSASTSASAVPAAAPALQQRTPLPESTVKAFSPMAPARAYDGCPLWEDKTS